MKSEERFNTFSKNLSNEIDINQIFLLIIKNKKFISTITIIGIILSTLYSLYVKRTWKGTFQIVLNSANESLKPLSLNQSRYRDLLKSTEENVLDTEVEILKSPSVLMETFEFVKQNKRSKNDSSLKGVIFEKWRDNFFQTDLQQRTTILNVTFKDKDKTLIIPALKKISSSYQEYSGKKRIRNLELAENFYKEQISNFRSKSLNSFKKAQEYATEQNLTIPIGLSENKDNQNFFSIVAIEENRIKATTELKILDQKLKEINTLKNSDQIYYFVSYIEKSNSMDIFNKLNAIDLKLSKFMGVYKNSDKQIEELKREKNILFEILKKQLKGYIQSRKETENAKLKNYTRPKGVISEYRQLLLNAQKDQRTLNELETQFRLNALEKAKSVDPWELITKPNLWPYPIAPNRKLIVLSGALLGLFLGIALTLFNDRKKDLILSAIEINALTGWPLIAEFSLNNKNLWGETLKSISYNYLNEVKGAVLFLLTSEEKKSKFEEISEEIKNNTKNSKILFSNNLKEVSMYDSIIMVVDKEQTKRSTVVNFIQKLSIQKKNILGFIFVDKFDDK